MKASLISLGICKSARCNVPGNAPVERYEGPGMFCPDCGELLQAYDPTEATVWSLPPKEEPEPDPDGLTERRNAPALPSRRKSDAKAGATRSKLFARGLIFGGGLAAAMVLVAVIVSGTLDSAHAAASNVIGVCGSSVSGRLAKDILHAYTANQAYANRFEVRAANCDVRFDTVNETRLSLTSAQTSGTVRQTDGLGSPIAYDAIVAIVNPQNPITSVSIEELRGLYSGATKRWWKAAGMNEPVSVFLPNDTTDEGQMVVAAILKGAPAGSSVVRLASSADVVKAVTAPNARTAIGMVAFSEAVPGKVIAIKNYLAPSILSISEQRYPFILGVVAHAKQQQPQRDLAVPGFLQYVTSEGAKAVAVRDGFVR